MKVPSPILKAKNKLFNIFKPSGENVVIHKEQLDEYMEMERARTLLAEQLNMYQIKFEKCEKLLKKSDDTNRESSKIIKLQTEKLEEYEMAIKNLKKRREPTEAEITSFDEEIKQSLNDCIRHTGRPQHFVILRDLYSNCISNKEITSQLFIQRVKAFHPGGFRVVHTVCINGNRIKIFNALVGYKLEI